LPESAFHQLIVRRVGGTIDAPGIITKKLELHRRVVARKYKGTQKYKGTDKLLEQGLAMEIRSEAALDAPL
jgi:hypothetical protein